MKKQPTFTINGKETKVNVEAPDALCEAIGHERASQLIFSFGIAHWVQAKVKGAFKLVAEPGDSNESTVKKAKELVAQVEAGDTLQFTDFVPSPRGESKEFLAFAKRWDNGTKQSRTMFLFSMGLDASYADKPSLEVYEAAKAKENEDELMAE